MALQLYLGSSGSGKSYRLYRRMIENSIEDRNTEYLVIVPEQFTMQTQKDIVAMHPDHGVMNLDILSFMRLAYRVFDETGGNDRPVLEDTGKSMLVRKVVQFKKDELTSFGAQIRRTGFISEIKSLLSEIFQYSIGEEELHRLIDAFGHKPMLKGKLQDMLTVYRGFKELIRERYITAEEILDVLYDALDDCRFIKNSVICFDGFTGFTPSQYRLLSKLMKMARNVYVTVTIDGREDISRQDEEFRLFHLSKKTILKLYHIADENHVDIMEPDRADGQIPYRFKDSPAMAALEHNLFRYPQTSCPGDIEDIQIYASENIPSEINYTIRMISKLVRTKGYRYRDIAVVTGDIGLYGRMIEKEYERADIPFFIDRKKDILSNSFVELIRALLEMLERDFDYNSVFRYLRCGLADFSEEETDRLENYVLALGIRGFARWNKPFTRCCGRMTEEDLAVLNEYRMRFVESLASLKESTVSKNRTVLAYTRALYDFIVEHHIYDRLMVMEKKFDETGRRLLAKEYKQIYSIVMEVFDRMAELLGDEEVTLKEYEELLETGFHEAKVGLIPPGVDQVVVGDIERTRLKDIRALFFVGVNDGIIPKAGGGGGILSDLDRELLASEHIELAPTRRQSAYTEQFYLYLNMTKPREKLYISYSRVGEDGKAQNPSYLIGKIKGLFPDLIIEQGRTAEIDDAVWKEEPDLVLGSDRGLSYLTDGIRAYADKDMPDIWKELLNHYMKEEEYKRELEQLVEAAYYEGGEQAISKAAARALYGVELHNSVSRLEKYAECAFAHFLLYGIELRKRQEYKISVPDMGNLFHTAIELFSQKMKEQGFSWHEIDDSRRDKMAEEAVLEAAGDYGNTVLYSSKRNEYIINRVERMTKRTLWALCRQIREGRFEPSGYEIRFSPAENLASTVMKLSNDETMRLTGRIDRLDTYEDEENVYIKVIDYKSGNTTFDMQKIYYGLSMQLVVYLGAAMEASKERFGDKVVIPAGIFYYNIEDPVIDKPAGSMTEEELQDLILAELKMDGLSNSNRDILSYIDRAFEKEKSVKSRIIPVELTARGEFGAYSQVADSARFQSLLTFVRNRICSCAREIMDGNVAAAPFRMGNRTACDYCSFPGVCGFDKKLKGYEYRNLDKMDRDAVWEEIDGKDPVDTSTTESN